MKKPIELPLPKCKKCGKQLEPQFTTEKEEGDNTKPEALILFGVCEDCKCITVCNVIKVKDLPNEKEFMKFAISENQEEKGCGKEVKVHPKVKIKCGKYVMSWDRVFYCDECKEKSEVKE